MTTTPPRPKASPDLLASSAPFVLPFIVFMILLALSNYFPHRHYYFYPIKAGIVGVIIAYYWRLLPDLKPTAPLVSVAVGIVGVVIWVGLDPASIQFNVLLQEGFNRVAGLLGLTSWQGTVDGSIPVGRSPFALYGPGEAWTLYILRVLGISLCVPIMEELFWRGFLMRWLIREDFMSVPLGTYSAYSFWGVTALFALEHGSEWLLGLVVGIIFGVLFVRTKSLGNVILAHGVTNLLLALYCLAANDWHFLSTISTTTTPR